MVVAGDTMVVGSEDLAAGRAASEEAGPEVSVVLEEAAVVVVAARVVGRKLWIAEFGL